MTSKTVAKFVDNVVIPAFQQVVPPHGGNDLPVSSWSEVERSRGDSGMIFPTGIPFSNEYLVPWVRRMAQLVTEGGQDLEVFKDFFFVTWAVGVKVSCHPGSLARRFPEIRWDTLDPNAVYVDHGIEVAPPEGSPALVGLAGAFVEGDSHTHEHFKQGLKGDGGIKDKR